MPRRGAGEVDDFDFSGATHPQQAKPGDKVLSPYGSATASRQGEVVRLEIDFPETTTSVDLRMVDAQALHDTLSELLATSSDPC